MILLLLATVASAHVPVVYSFGPGDDWCGFMNQTITVGGEAFYPGDVVVLGPGEYGPCAFTAPVTDNDTEFTILQSEDASDPAHFVHSGTSDAILDIDGTHLFLVDLAFEGVPAEVSAVRLTDPTNIWVRSSRFAETAGTGLRIVGQGEDVWVLDTAFVGGGTGVHVGCEGCGLEVRVRDAFFSGLSVAVLGEQGATVEVTDTVVSGGSRGFDLEGGAGAAMISANLLVDVDLGIRIGGGAAVVRNTIVSAASALVVEQGSATRVLGNSFVQGTISVTDLAEATDNAGPDLLGPGNTTCTDACWVDVAALDFYPAVDSPLRDAAQGTDDAALNEDFCGRVRAAGTGGAVDWVGEAGWGPIEVGFKREFPCTFQEPPGSPGFEEVECCKQRVCACGATGSGVGSMLLWFLVPWALRRRSAAL